MSDRALTQLSAARHALAECKTAMESKRVMEVANAARDLLERVKASEDAVNEAIEVRLLAQRQMGEFLAETPKNTGQLKRGPVVPQGDHGDRPTLSSMGITKKESATAQRLAVMPEEEFQRRIEEGKRSGRLTVSAVVNPPQQQVVYDASTDEEQVDVIAPEKPAKKKRDNYKLGVGMHVVEAAIDQMKTIQKGDADFVRAHEAMIEFCQNQIRNNR